MQLLGYSHDYGNPHIFPIIDSIFPYSSSRFPYTVCPINFYISIYVVLVLTKPIGRFAAVEARAFGAAQNFFTRRGGEDRGDCDFTNVLNWSLSGY